MGDNVNMNMTVESFGTTSQGMEITMYRLETASVRLGIIDYGTTLVSLCVKDKDGEWQDIVLGYDNVHEYENDADNNMGCNMGRCVNRIAGGHFVLDGVEYQLECNDGENTIHSGSDAYCRRKWTYVDSDETSVTFVLNSRDGDQGFPGNLLVYVTYRFLSDNKFEIEYEGTPDKDTIINMTNHSYFNLNGEGNGKIYDHKLVIYADSFTPSGKDAIPTGEIRSVDKTPMDYRSGKTIGQDINTDYEQLLNANGYDHNWITVESCTNNACTVDSCIGNTCMVDTCTGNSCKDNSYAECSCQDNSCELHRIVEVTGDISGIHMTIETDYPGMQMYTGNFISNERRGVKGKNGHIYSERDGVCFEPQYYPDAINHKNFISPVCRAGKRFNKRIVYTF